MTNCRALKVASAALVTAGLLLSLPFTGAAKTLYVNLNNPTPASPYTSWSTAALTIQIAIDAAAARDEIVVTNGLYRTGGRLGYGSMSNRVAVSKALYVHSVNGPEVTVIQGYQVPGTTNGNGAVRCAYLTAGATLAGFTLTNGATRAAGDLKQEQSGGGLWCLAIPPPQFCLVSNCVLTGNSAANNGGGAYYGTLTNCTLTGNSAYNGGGAYSATLNNCTLTTNTASSQGGGANLGKLTGCTLAGNSASYTGGGMFNATVTNCAFTGNSASSWGGGADNATLVNCTVTGNSAPDGAGAFNCTLNNCTLTSNSAAHTGGGSYYGTLNNCVLTSNSAANSAGGVFDGTLNNCTLTGNSASRQGGGAYACTLNNCVIYYNLAAANPNYNGGTVNYCCTTPLPGSGTGNIDAEPQLASDSHLSLASPCRGAGSAAYASGKDIDGEPWANPPSIGCDELYAGTATGPLSVSLLAPYTNVVAGYTANFAAAIAGRLTASQWDFGDATVASNRPYASHAWGAPGDYLVVLRAYNDSNPGGVSATAMVHVTQPVHYVAANSPSPLAPYTSWATAATNIQDAVDAATVLGALVLVNDGVYSTGGRVVSGALTNRVAVTMPLVVRSVNGPEVTVVCGYQVPGTLNGDSGVRCVYLAGGATLAGFTLTNGATRAAGDQTQEQSGGGVWCASASAVVSNCLVTGNSAYHYGGGTYLGTLYNCALTGNSAYSSGGGASFGTLNNCTLTGNSAFNSGGGASYSILNNCILYYNLANVAPNYDSGAFNYCCTTPLPGGTGNIDADPQLASASHLSAASPCRGAGSAAYASGVDIDGEPWANPPSIGCDEVYAGTATGPLSVIIQAPYTNVMAGFTANFTAAIAGRLTASQWDFGDGTVPSNRPYALHAWGALGDYLVVLRAYNDSNPGGVSATTRVHVVTQPVHYVAANSSSPMAPYTSWVTAATNIQDAVDAATAPGALVLVNDGIYSTGGRVVAGLLSNRVAVMMPLVVQSVNGPGATVIQGCQVPGVTNGDGAVRCVYLTNGVTLAGFTLTNGATRAAGDFYWEQSGGGVWCAPASVILTNCVINGNSAAYKGGGTYYGTLHNCALTGNSASYGGGACHGTLNDCVLTGNSAVNFGGGAEYGTLTNCMLARNSAANFGGGVDSSTLNNCTLAGNSAFSQGGGAQDSTLINCALTNNSTPHSGGGACSGTLYNCTLTGNSAQIGGGACYGTLNNCTLTANSAPNGGGAFYGTLNNCTLTGNSAQIGGGAEGSTLNNCTLTGNWASSGGGANWSTLNNSIIYGNSAPSGANYDYFSTLTYCCADPLSAGIGNFANDPMFVNPAGGNLRLQSNSPCINSGRNAYVSGATDLDGNPRIKGGTVDVGAYEFQTPSSTISYAWLQQYGLPTDGSADSADTDGDGMNNWQEWIVGTNPTNAASVLRMLSATGAVSGVTVAWSSVTGRSYSLERATDLGASPAFSLLQSNIAGLAGTTSFNDTNPPVSGPAFYRADVQP